MFFFLLSWSILADLTNFPIFIIYAIFQFVYLFKPKNNSSLVQAWLIFLSFFLINWNTKKMKQRGTWFWHLEKWRLKDRTIDRRLLTKKLLWRSSKKFKNITCPSKFTHITCTRKEEWWVIVEDISGESIIITSGNTDFIIISLCHESIN